MSFSWVTKFYSLKHFAKCGNYVVLTGHRQGGSGLDLACAPQLAGPGLKLWKFPLPEAGIQHQGSWLGGSSPVASPGWGDLSILGSALSRPWSFLYSLAGGERGQSGFAGIFPGQPGGAHITSSHIPLVPSQQAPNGKRDGEAG